MLNTVVFHFIWDLVYIFGKDIPLFKTVAAMFWQQFICWGFILISGISLKLGKNVKNHVKNGAVLFAWGAALSAATMLLMPKSRILFGILTFLGSAALTTIALDKYLKKIPPMWGAALSFACFMLIKEINYGTVFYGKLSLPPQLYNGMLATYIGFTQKGFYSADYFSVLPWIFLYFCGYFISPAVAVIPDKIARIRIPVLDMAGKRSLMIYLLHQPLIFLVLWITEMLK